MKLTRLLRNAFGSAEQRHKQETSKRNARDRYHAKRLSKELGIPVTTERDSVGYAYWIETDAWNDDRFCTSWGEVREKLEQIKQETAQ